MISVLKYVRALIRQMWQACHEYVSEDDLAHYLHDSPSVDLCWFAAYRDVFGRACVFGLRTHRPAPVLQILSVSGNQIEEIRLMTCLTQASYSQSFSPRCTDEANIQIIEIPNK